MIFFGKNLQSRKNSTSKLFFKLNPPFFTFLLWFHALWNHMCLTKLNIYISYQINWKKIWKARWGRAIAPAAPPLNTSLSYINLDCWLGKFTHLWYKQQNTVFLPTRPYTPWGVKNVTCNINCTFLVEYQQICMHHVSILCLVKQLNIHL